MKMVVGAKIDRKTGEITRIYRDVSDEAVLDMARRLVQIGDMIEREKARKEMLGE